MKNANRRRRESQGAIRGLVAQHPEAYTTDLAKKAIADLDASNGTVDAGLAAVSRGRALMRKAVIERDRLRRAIRRAVHLIVRTAALVCLDLGRANDFATPEQGSDRQMMADASATAERALSLLDRFVEHKLAASIITDLPKQIAAFDATMVQFREGRAIRAAARTSIASGFEAGSNAMDVLERTFMNAFGDDAAAVSEWQNSRRVGPAREVEAPAESAPDTSAAPAQTKAS